MSGFFLSRQKEMRDLQYQCSKLHGAFQRSESALRGEMLGSLEETKEAGRKEVGGGIGGGDRGREEGSGEEGGGGRG